MARETINIGFTPGDGQGDTPREAGAKLNRMLAEIYTLLHQGSAGPVIQALAALDAPDASLITLDPDGPGLAPIGDLGRQLLAGVDPIAVRALLALGSMALQSATSVAITGGSISGIVDLGIADGGTGASSAPGALTNLGGTIPGQAIFTAATYAAMRGLLQLGSAATATLGNAAGNALQLDAGSKVPMANIPEALVGAMNYRGAWNAAANIPALAADPDPSTKGHFYVVAVAGATNLSGVIDWKVGDWAVSNGASWDKIDSSDQVARVAGLMGDISAADLRTALGLAIGLTIQAFDPDLDAIAALATAPFGRGLLTLIDQSAALAAIGAQPRDADLDAIAALATTGYGRGLLALVDDAAGRAALGLGSAATRHIGSGPGNVPILDADSKLLASMMPSIAVDQKFSVASQPQMLGLVAEIGDIAIRTDFTPARRYMLIDADPSALANWQRLVSPADVVGSLAGMTGDITLAQLVAAIDPQPHDADLDAIAALTTAPFGRDLLTKPSGGAVRAAIGAEQIGVIAGINHQAGTAYTLALPDAGLLVDCANAAEIVVTVPGSAAVAFPIGTRIPVRWGDGAGQVRIAPDLTVTLQSVGNKRRIADRFCAVELIKIDVDAWWMFGALAA